MLIRITNSLYTKKKQTMSSGILALNRSRGIGDMTCDLQWEHKNGTKDRQLECENIDTRFFHYTLHSSINTPRQSPQGNNQSATDTHCSHVLKGIRML